jgi:hypothetical protein
LIGHLDPKTMKITECRLPANASAPQESNRLDEIAAGLRGDWRGILADYTGRKSRLVSGCAVCGWLRALFSLPH